MNGPAASGPGILQGFSFKRRDKPRGLKPTGGIQSMEWILTQLNQGYKPQ
jgi:hypothetical protein